MNDFSLMGKMRKDIKTVRIKEESESLSERLEAEIEIK